MDLPHISRRTKVEWEDYQNLVEIHLTADVWPTSSATDSARCAVYVPSTNTFQIAAWLTQLHQATFEHMFGKTAGGHR